MPCSKIDSCGSFNHYLEKKYIFCHFNFELIYSLIGRRSVVVKKFEFVFHIYFLSVLQNGLGVDRKNSPTGGTEAKLCFAVFDDSDRIGKRRVQSVFDKFDFVDLIIGRINPD